MFYRLFWLVVFVCTFCEARDEDVPDKTSVSPRGTFKIVQHFEGDWPGSGWTEVLQFTDASARRVTLENGMWWAAEYFIAPDDGWMLRIQKSGSGDNISWFYRIDAEHRVWRMEEQIGALGFAYLEKKPGLSHDLYHTGIEFVSWDLKAGLLRFSIHGSVDRESGKGIERDLIYDLKKQTIRDP